MEHIISVEITIEGTATGTYPVGQINDALYEILDQLADMDASGPDLVAQMPRKISARTGIGTKLIANIRILDQEGEVREEEGE